MTKPKVLWGRLLGAVIVLSLIANGVFGYLMYSMDERVDDRIDELEVVVEGKADSSDLTSKASISSVTDLRFDIDALDSRLGQPSGIGTLRSDLRFLENQFYDFLELYGSSPLPSGGSPTTVGANDIDTPIGCLGGDLVVWANFGGLTC